MSCYGHNTTIVIEQKNNKYIRDSPFHIKQGKSIWYLSVICVPVMYVYMEMKTPATM